MVPCELGGGMDMCLGITMSDVECAAKFGVPFTPCTYPGPLPQCLQNATQYQIAATKELNNQEIKLCNKQYEVIPSP